MTQAKKLQIRLKEAGVNTFRVVAHADGSMTAGFLHAGDAVCGEQIAREAAQRIAKLGFQIIEAGNDLAPGYKTLGWAGTITPMVRFTGRGEEKPMFANSSKTDLAAPVSLGSGRSVQVWGCRRQQYGACCRAVLLENGQIVRTFIVANPKAAVSAAREYWSTADEKAA